jgi:hypothetical protein
MTAIQFLFLRPNGQHVTVSAPDIAAAQRKARAMFGSVRFLGISAQH